MTVRIRFAALFLVLAPFGVACGDDPAPRDAKPGRIPDGVYRNEWTTEELVAAGLTAEVAADYSGLHTFRLDDGRLVGEQVGQYRPPPCYGSYTSTATTVQIRFETNCSGGFTASWTIRDDKLVFTNLQSLNEADTALTNVMFGTKQFQKIG